MRAAFALRIISGKIILNFGVQKRLRAFLNPIFTDGVVKENGICSACFLRKRGAVGVPAPPRGPTSPGRGKMSPQVTKRGICRAATEGIQIGGAGKNG